MVAISVVTIPDFAMRYISRYLVDDAIRIAILVYRVNQCTYICKKTLRPGNAIGWGPTLIGPTYNY